ncbi:hypothetical protein H8D64_02105 [PVC group bacterium]|nr:hypothetical protein [PVC group bacterium]
MTNKPVIFKASYITPEGYGSSSFGSKNWLDESGKPCVNKDLMSIKWSTLFSSSCSRFGRMDPLSRLGLLTTELFDIDFANQSDEENNQTGFCMASNYGTISTDIKFLQNISPSTFVYTLPSSVMGEVCIRHKLRGPCLCLMSHGNDGQNVIQEACERIEMGEATSMLCLFCDIRTDDAQQYSKSTLDKNINFWWYSYGLYLTENDIACGEGKPFGNITSEMDIRQICLNLCNNVEAL